MPAKSKEFITLCYDNYPDQREFVFSMKGRPFSMLSSQKLPTPSTSLIDFNLVSDLGLKMTDLQCSKFSFGGQRFRILGKISQTVQTITDGVVSGTVHLRASVVEGLRSVFDSHSIAGKKISELLSRKISSGNSPPASPQSSPASSPRSPKTPPSAVRKKMAATEVKKAPPVNSPPGFPTVPQYSNHRPDVVRDKPSVPLNKPPPGSVRRLQLKPDDDHRMDWHHGRVIRLIRDDLAQVNVLRLEGDPYKEDQPVYDENCVCPDLNVSVNDVVLFRGWDRDPNLETWSESRPRIYVVYNQEEVGHLQHHGVEVPDCPPEMRPAGYYG